MFRCTGYELCDGSHLETRFALRCGRLPCYVWIGYIPLLRPGCKFATFLPVYSAGRILPAEAPETVLRALSAALSDLLKPPFGLAKTYTNEYGRKLDV